jgi:hypothetical protein
MTVVSKHAKLDQAILNTIASGKGHIALRALPEVSETALHSVRNPDDVLNGRLQFLRKKGRILFAGGYWQLSETEK